MPGAGAHHRLPRVPWLAGVLFLIVTGTAAPPAADAQGSAFWRGEISVRAGVPAFTVGGATRPRNVTLFLSPSCNFCNRLYMDLFDAVEDDDFDVTERSLTFVLFPRNAVDYPLSRGLLCVGPDRFPAAFHRYQREIYNEYRGRPIKAKFARALVRRIVAEVGGPGHAACVASAATTDALHRSHALGARLAEEKGSMPLVLVDGKPTDIESYRELERHD